MTDPIKLLKEDHKKVKDLFTKFRGMGKEELEEKQMLADMILQELEIHTQIEEEFFYPAVQERGDKELQEKVAEANEEHRMAKILIEELHILGSDDEGFDAKMKVLMENVEHHIKEEEDNLMPSAQDALGDEAGEIGDKMKAMKVDLVDVAEA